jgi:RimJ/RimL family protein N-acetyltransferase
VYLDTQRLLIRDLEVDDIPALVGLWTDPDVTRYMGGPRDAAGLSRSLGEDAAAIPATFDLRPVVEKVSGEVVGHCGLLEKLVDGSPEIELVYVFVKAAWGRGLATEAARALRNHAISEMGIHRLIALIDPDNAASARVAAKIGLEFEKTTVRPGGKEMQVYSLANPAADAGSPRDTA